ncbi:hypothetical protein THMIRHAM_17500 [Thiomicrorhabdus immobilis]|uniref:Tetratricopeptide repeat protein n=1 Tax=Thiomicrorhabdus immobilis TaxID=2791037 RepID=A0ABM7MF25_9GAMM|nr:tetratricopeptide repeat protein [Thiomicrorhabdus immobilis]BCN93965.1 hypothetical protein THMIRHAM_17500 [Thiomicrorhabdus immobilis]
MKNAMLPNIDFFRAVLVLFALISFSGCTQFAAKNESKNDYSTFSQQVEPLSTELGPTEELDFALDLAKLLIERKKFSQAETLLHRLRKVNRDDIRVYRMLAQIYEAQQKSNMAFVAWLEINKFTDKTIDDESELARLSLINEDFSLAETIYYDWLKSDELNRKVSALNNLGFSAILQKKYQRAQSFFMQALEHDPLNAKALNNLKLVKSLVE